MAPRFLLCPQKDLARDHAFVSNSKDVSTKTTVSLVPKIVSRLESLVQISPLVPSLNLYHSIGISVDADSRLVEKTIRELRAAFHPDRPRGSREIFDYLSSIKAVLVDSPPLASKYHNMLREPYFPHGGELYDSLAMLDFLTFRELQYVPRAFPMMRKFQGPAIWTRANSKRQKIK